MQAFDGFEWSAVNRLVVVRPHTLVPVKPVSGRPCRKLQISSAVCSTQTTGAILYKLTIHPPPCSKIHGGVFLWEFLE
jgi:hypothetical protein